MRSFVQRDGLSDDIGAGAQPALPELMADDDDAALLGLLFFRHKSAPQLRRRAERGEEVTGDKYSGDFYCAITGGNRRHPYIVYIVRRQTGKAPRLRAPGQEIGVRDRRFRDTLAPVALPELHQAVGFVIRERT